MAETTDLPAVAFASEARFRAWLNKNHAKSSGIWLKYAKKGTGIPSISYPEAVDVALCYGWIDGQRARVDGTYFLQRFTPRRPRSKWSRINRDKAETLIESGQMHAAGLVEIERAKSDGRWETAYDSQKHATVPPDFDAALKSHPTAAAFFDTLDSVNRYAILYRIQTAVKPETRERRIATFVAMLERGEKIH